MNEAPPDALALFLVDTLRRRLELGHQKLNQIFIRADARTLIHVVPQLLLCDGVLGCPTLGVTVALAVAAAEITPIYTDSRLLLL